MQNLHTDLGRLMGIEHMYREYVDYHHQVRIAIAGRKDITEKAASILSKDPLPQVRWVLAQNVNVPLDIIMSLCEDSDRKVRDEAMKIFLAR